MKLNIKNIIIIGSIAIILIISIFYSDNNTIQTSSTINLSNTKIEWGIKRSDNHMQPDLGKRNKELIEKFNGMAMGNSNDKIVYLTFDNGYEAGYTSNILDTLKNNNVPATFFITAHYVNTASELVQRMVDEGHILRKSYS